MVAANYYNENYDAIDPFIHKLDENESDACKLFKNVYYTTELRQQLFTASEFTFVVEAIEHIQNPELSSEAQIDIVEDVHGKLSGRFKKKLDESLRKNPDNHGFNKLDNQMQSTVYNQKQAPMVSVEA